MQLTLITINYNGSENTIKLLESLKNQTDKVFEIIVADNNSDDIGKLMDYKTSETNIIYIKNDKNLGYSGGNNVGIKKALEMWEADPAQSSSADHQQRGQTLSGASWVLLLNNDTLPESRLIEYLKANLEDKEGIIGLALNEENGTAFAGQISWLKPTLSHITTPRVVMAKSVDNLWTNDTGCRCYAIGGAVVIHRNVFDKIGFLDENYFLYFEDADFCQRARRVGIPISFLPEIKISHSVSASTKKLGPAMLLRYHYRNALYFNWKNGPWYIKLLVLPWSWIIAIKQILKIAVGKNREQSTAILKGVGDFYRKKYGKISNF
ncbi:MAG: glycosyltransferase family 2 protein [Candidatus Yanofskybacteria bacterium]|nr:glycosyltransferase family 2 protein [Candidatus Yanofskybacteria bacterium]